MQSNLNTFYFFNFELYVFIRSNDLVLKLNQKCLYLIICTYLLTYSMEQSPS